MMTNLANILIWLLTIVTPASATFYASGPWLGINACAGEFRLPNNPDVEIIVNTSPSPDLEAKSYVVLTDKGHIWLAEKEANTSQAIASITKLMTALVFLDHNPGWETEYKIKREDVISGGKIHLFLGDTIKLKDLFAATLIASDNGASISLARSTGLTDEEFITKMNEKAKDLGLMKANFVDPVGLGDGNYASAKDIARLAQMAFSQPDISREILKAEYNFVTGEGKKKYLHSTDSLLASNHFEQFESLGGKTGYTEAAGYSFVGRFKNEDNRVLIIVVLDAGGKLERFEQAEILADWAFKNCKW